MRFTQMQQEVQGQQTFNFSVATVDDEHTKSTGVSKESVGAKFKEGACAELCLKLLFESDWYFCNINKSGWF